MFRDGKLSSGIRVRVWTTDKFKTVTFRLIFRDAISRDPTRTALVPMVLRRGSEELPTSRDVAREMERLYGADFRTDTYKLGEQQAVSLHLQLPSARYLAEGEGIIARGLHHLAGLASRPVLAEGAFRPEVVEQEKANLQRQMEAIFNDKAQYAKVRCLETMCAGEPYALTHLGRREDLPDIHPADLYARYRDLVEHAPAELYAVGDVGWEEVVHLAEEELHLPRGEERSLPPVVPHTPPPTVRRVEEVHEVNQGKLVLGFVTDVRPQDPLYVPLTVAVGILGGFTHSKLFQHVRERASLAYYAYARLDGLKGIMLVHAGIDFARREQVVDMVLEQVEAIRRGEVDPEEELGNTVRALANHMRAALDSPSQSILTDLELDLMGRRLPLAERLRELERVRVEDVAAAMSRVQLDTDYFLTRAGEGA